MAMKAKPIKVLHLTIFLMALSLFASAQTKDEAAVQQVVKGEIKDFHTNADRRMIYSNWWQLLPETRWVSTNLEGNVLFLTSDVLKEAIAKNFIPPADSAMFTFSNFVVKASDKVGWATFDDKSVSPDGNIIYSHQFRLLEKVGSTWKIVSGGLHQYKPQ